MCFAQRGMICGIYWFPSKCALSNQPPLMTWYWNPNWTEFFHIVNTKLNDLLCDVTLRNASFWTSPITTYFFRTAKYRSKGNILWRKTGPRIPISLTRWTRRCVIILKNDGGNIISRLTKLWITYSCRKLDGCVINSMDRLPSEKLCWERRISL